MSDIETLENTQDPFAGYMQNSKGHMVPESLVKPTDKIQDQLVNKLMGFADDLNAQLKRFNAHCFDDMHACMDLLAEDYGITRGGDKGNVTFTSYDGLCRVQIAVQDRIEFGPELQIAKEIMDRCIGKWAAGSRDEIKALVNYAFDVEKTGHVNRAALFQLRRLESDDPEWQQAIKAINDSIRTISSKSYVRFYRRKNVNERFKAVPIALASV